MNTHSISLSVASRIHDAFAVAERRRITVGNEHRPPNIVDLPVLPPIQENFPMIMPPNGFIMPSSGYEMLPTTTAPLDFTCTVCFEKVRKGDKQQLLNCGHKFCVKCITKWLQTNHQPSCPNCRTPICR